MRRVTRRAVLLGGAAAAVTAIGITAGGIESGAIPGRGTLYQRLGLNGPDGVAPRVTVGPATSGSFDSPHRPGVSTGWQVSYPPGSAIGDPLPVMITLHGAHGDHTSAFGYLALDRYQAAAHAAGAPDFAIASVDGGLDYWHARASGSDAGAMVVDDLIPMLGDDLGLDVSRIALHGWSMGGYGALLIGSELGPTRVACVSAESPAMWRSWQDSAHGAFDDEADYDAHVLRGRQSRLDGIPVRIDCGHGDGFYPVVRGYAEGFDEPIVTTFEPGGHTPGYWRRMAPAQLAWVGRHLG